MSDNMKAILIEVTASDDARPVYAIAPGVDFGELSDGQKELVYESQRYLYLKSECEFIKTRNEMELLKAMIYRMLNETLVLQSRVMGHLGEICSELSGDKDNTKPE